MADALTQIETREKISRLMNLCHALTSSRPVMEFQNTPNCLHLALAHAALPHRCFIADEDYHPLNRVFYFSLFSLLEHLSWNYSIGRCGLSVRYLCGEISASDTAHRCSAGGSNN